MPLTKTCYCLQLYSIYILNNICLWIFSDREALVYTSAENNCEKHSAVHFFRRTRTAVFCVCSGDGWATENFGNKNGRKKISWNRHRKICCPNFSEEQNRKHVNLIKCRPFQIFSANFLPQPSFFLTWETVKKKVAKKKKPCIESLKSRPKTSFSDFLSSHLSFFHKFSR